jgi:radical SAM superfamily enzyme YgiQ (UPF0313 family)
MTSLKIVFTNLNNTLFADGSRILSARLKQMGHSVRMIFMTMHGRVHYSDHALEQFAELARDADLVLYSFLSDNFMRAARMTGFLKKRLSAPMVWGGIHATIEPEESLKYVDILCRGEGDEALPEFVERLATKRPALDVRNFWFKTAKGVIRNEMRPLLQDLDSNPWPDYSGEDHFILDGDDRLKPMTDELLLKYHNQAPLGFQHYPVTSARGCAYHCAYCYNAAFKEMFKGQRRLRFRSLPDVVEEIRTTLDRFPFLRSFSFSDDDFFLRPIEQLEELADLISEKLEDVISRSFWGCCVTPHSLNAEKLALLSSVGLKSIVLGVQTGSERLNREVYSRNFKNDLLFEKAGWLDREFHRRMIFLLDLLVCGPYETEEDTAMTVDMMLKLPEWFNYSVYKFTYYPGSPIYRRAVKEGLIPPGPEGYNAKDFMVAYNKGYNYTTHLVILLSCAKNLVPRWILKLLARRPGRWVGRLLPVWLLDRIPWARIYFRLWARNFQAIYKGREIRHH